jgi:hypothetical protein
MCVIIPFYCRIHCTSLGLFHINTGPCHVTWFCCCSYIGISNQHNVSPSLFDLSRQFHVRYNPLLVLYTLHVTRISPYKRWTLSCHMSLFCSHTGISNHNNASPSLFDISSQFDVRYNPLLVPYTLHVTRLVHINTGPCHVIWFYCCSYTGISNQHNVSPSLFDISRQFDVRYNDLLSCHMSLL